MKIYSWNVWDDNKTPKQALAFIQQLDFDILCLQEVPESLLQKLKVLPYSQAHFIDLRRLRPHKDHKENMCYLVILTRYPIVNHGGFLTCPTPVYPLRTRAFLGLGVFGFTRLKDHGALYADIQFPGRALPVRVFSLHLRLNGPLERKKELAIVSSHIDNAASTIVCGDFNIIDQPLQKAFSWLLGSSIREALPWYPERQLMEKRFASLGLKNVLRGQRTNTLFANQLDHVLVPKGASVISAGVCEDSFGSDHYPVYVSMENF